MNNLSNPSASVGSWGTTPLCAVWNGLSFNMNIYHMDNVAVLPDAPPVDLSVTVITYDSGGACLGGVQPLPHDLGFFINLKLDH